MLLNEIKEMVDHWMGSKSEELKKQQESLKQETDRQIQNMKAAYSQQAATEQEMLRTERERNNKENDTRVQQMEEVQKRTLTAKQEIDSVLREQKSIRDQERKALNERETAINSQKKEFDRAMAETKDEVQRTLKKKADNSRVNELQEELDEVKSKAGRGSTIPLFLSVLAITLVVAMAIIGAILMRSKLVDAQEKMEQMQAEIDVLSTTPKPTPTPAPTPEPTPEPTEEPTEEPTPDPASELTAEYLITNMEAINQTFELEKVRIVVHSATITTLDSTADGVEPEVNEDDAKNEDEIETQDPGYDDTLGTDVETSDKNNPEYIEGKTDQETTVPSEIDETRAEEKSKSWQTMFVLTSNNRSIELSVNSEVNAVQEGLDWAKQLLTVAPEATMQWYPEHPLAANVIENELISYYLEDDDLIDSLSWFDPFTMVIFKNENDSMLIGYIVLSANAIPEIDAMKADEDVAFDSYRWFENAELTINDVFSYVFAKNNEDAKQTVNSFMNPEERTHE